MTSGRTKYFKYFVFGIHAFSRLFQLFWADPICMVDEKEVLGGKDAWQICKQNIGFITYEPSSTLKPQW